MATKTALQRLQRDLVEVQKDDSLVAGPEGSDLMHWMAIIAGPDNSVWEGAMLRLELKFPNDYPQNPPKVKFITRVFHPNVYGGGEKANGEQYLCLDVLSTMWSPSTDVRSLLVSIQSLLVDPNPASPANAEAAELYVRDRMAYNARVRAVAAASLAAAEADAANDGDDE